MARTESSTKWIDRNRAPRVHITYDVEEGGALRNIELPFVVGVMAGLSGDNAGDLPELDDRAFDEVDIDNFDDYLKKQKPRAAFKTENMLEGEGELGVDVTFEEINDFSPDQLAMKVGAETEEFAVTKADENAWQVEQKGPFSEAIGTQITSPDDLTVELVAARMRVDPTEVSVDKVPDVNDENRVNIKVTKKGPLAILLEARNALSELIARADGKKNAQEMLERIMGDPELQKLITGGGAEPEAAPPAAAEAPPSEAEAPPAEPSEPSGDQPPA